MKQPESGPSALLYRIETWGCAMNTHDSEKLAGLLEEAGYRPTADVAQADVILLNTCTVRDKAEEKVFSRLGSLRPLKVRNPSLIIGVCGCVAQKEGEAVFRRSGLADLILGPRAIESLPAMLEQVRRDRSRPVDLARRDDSIRFAGRRARRASGARAYLTIMEGCNKTCTYCVVPLTRGREVSKAAPEVVREAEFLAAAGYPEIELLGQNVNAYRSEGAHLGDLLQMLQGVEAIRRLRFATSHPAHLGLPIIRAMRDCPSVCNHLHLPVQSGADSVLERMQRGYTRGRYLDRVEKLRANVPGIALSTDIIVGYPGETSEEFRQTLSLLREVEFDQIYSFLYSPRRGTAADAEKDGVGVAEKRARHAELQALQQEIQLRRNQSLVGTVEEILVDGPSRQGRGQIMGRTRSNRVVNLRSGEARRGEFLQVEVVSAGPNSLEGRPAPAGLDLARIAVYK